MPPTIVAGPLGDDADDELARRRGRRTRPWSWRPSGRPTTRATSSSRPKAGGWAYRTYVLSDCVGRSTAVPNRVWPCDPPARRSSPWIGGPSFLRWTAIAIHDPTRACPSSSVVRLHRRARRPRRPTGATARAPSARSEDERRRRRGFEGARRLRAWRSGRVPIGARTSRPAGKLRRPARRGRPTSVGRSRRGARYRTMRTSRSPSASVPRPPEGPVPEIRPVPRPPVRRRPTVGDLAAVVAPPYDVIGPDEHERLLARHPANVVRLDLPRASRGDEPDDRYRRAARTLAAWRSDGTLHKDPHPSIYVYEQDYRVPGTDVERDAARLLRAAPARAVRAGRRRPAARADAVRPQGGPLQAASRDGREHEPGRRPVRRRGRRRRTALLAERTRGPPDVDVVDDDGVRHRLWAVPADGELGRRGRLPLTGGGRRRAGHDRRRPPSLRDRAALPRRAADEPLVRGGPGVRLPADAASSTAGRSALTVLPTHRLVRDLGDDGGERAPGAVPRRCSTSSRDVTASTLRSALRRRRRSRPAGRAGSGSGRAPVGRC